MDFYGYSGNAKMAFRITPENNAPEQASFTTTMTWQMCAEQCAAPETKNFTVTLKRGEGRPLPGSRLPGPGTCETLHSCLGARHAIPHLPGGKNRRPSSENVRDSPSGRSRLLLLRPGEINPTVPQTLKKLDDSTYELSMQFNDTTDGLYPNNLPEADKGQATLKPFRHPSHRR